MKNENQKHTGGFTLIELLIVVAIIAILAAIAVPNFLEAQTRSKVSRVKGDLRSVAVALHSYAVDHNRFPWRNTQAEPNTAASWQFPYGGNYFISLDEITGLTTPVAYITTNQLRDPFLSNSSEAQNLWYLNQLNEVGQVVQVKSFAIDRHGQSQGNPLFRTSTLTKVREPGWGMLSTGPDRFYNDEKWGQALPGGGVGAAHYTVYDPTNGTVSRGNIWRFGP